MFARIRTAVINFQPQWLKIALPNRDHPHLVGILSCQIKRAIKMRPGSPQFAELAFGTSQTVEHQPFVIEELDRVNTG